MIVNLKIKETRQRQQGRRSKKRNQQIMNQDYSNRVDKDLIRNLSRIENSAKLNDQNYSSQKEYQRGMMSGMNNPMDFNNGMPDHSMKNMMDQADKMAIEQSNQKSIFLPSQDFYKAQVTFNEPQFNQILEIDQEQLKNFEKNFSQIETKKSERDIYDEVSNFKLDQKIEQKVEELHQHLDHLNHFRTNYQDALQKILGQNLEDLKKSELDMNPEINHLLNVISGKEQDQMIEQNIKEFNEIFAQKENIEQKRAEILTSGSRIIDSNKFTSKSKGKNSDAISGDFMQQQLDLEPMDAIFELDENYTNTGMFNSYNMWSKINNQEKFDQQSFTRDQNLYGNFLTKNLKKNTKMPFK